MKKDKQVIIGNGERCDECNTKIKKGLGCYYQSRLICQKCWRKLRNRESEFPKWLKLK